MASPVTCDFIGGLSYAEVVAGRIDSRVIWGSSFASLKGDCEGKSVGKPQICIPSSASPEHGIPGASSCDLRAVFSGVERGKLSVSEKAAVQKFVSKLKNTGSFVRGCKGKRYEWLFANRSYSYGKNLGRVIEPCGAFSEVEHLCAGIVKDLQLGKPNACLLVYYPRGTSGLNCHKDDEPAHESDQVITLCHGVGAALVLKDNSKQVVAREWLEGGDFYVFRDQKSFYHGVDGVESTGSGRWAFTFRVFKQSSETAKSVPKSRPEVSNSVAVAKAFSSLACRRGGGSRSVVHVASNIVSANNHVSSVATVSRSSVTASSVSSVAVSSAASSVASSSAAALVAASSAASSVAASAAAASDER